MLAVKGKKNKHITSADSVRVLRTFGRRSLLKHRTIEHVFKALISWRARGVVWGLFQVTLGARGGMHAGLVASVSQTTTLTPTFTHTGNAKAPNHLSCVWEETHTGARRTCKAPEDALPAGGLKRTTFLLVPGPHS